MRARDVEFAVRQLDGAALHHGAGYFTAVAATRLVSLASVGELAFPDQRRTQRESHSTAGLLSLNETLARLSRVARKGCLVRLPYSE